MRTSNQLKDYACITNYGLFFMECYRNVLESYNFIFMDQEDNKYLYKYEILDALEIDDLSFIVAVAKQSDLIIVKRKVIGIFKIIKNPYN